MTAYTLDQARNWFLANAHGSLWCVHHGVSKECHSFTEAEALFRGDSSYRDETRDDEDDSSILGSMIAGGALFDSSSDIIDTTPDSTPDTSSFDSGGGDFGGGGGGSDF